MEYVDIAFEVIKPYVACIPDNDLKQLLKDTIGLAPDKAPVIKITEDVYVCELFGQQLHLKTLHCNYWVAFDYVLSKGRKNYYRWGNLWRYGFGGD